MARKLTADEKRQKLLDQLAALDRAAAAERMRDDPRMARIAEGIDRLVQIQHRASVTIKGRGRGNGAEARIAELRAEIAELEVRLNRDTAVELVIGEAIANAERFRDNVLSGDVEPTDPMPELPECLRPSTYVVTPGEAQREAEARARDEARAIVG